MPADRSTAIPRRPGRFRACALPVIAWLALAALWPVGAAVTSEQTDPHYGPAGFFDIHVCHWPGRPLFFMALFSSERHAEIGSVEVFTPEGARLTALDLNQYRTIRRDNRPDKRVFIRQVDVPDRASSGWYSAQIRLVNGELQTARDYVILQEMPLVTGQTPAPGTELGEVPEKLGWQPVPGATFYQVFVRDRWNNDRLVLDSELLTRPEIILPPGTLHKGGLYSWIVHARDTNEDIRLGDFNHGSLNAPAEFSILE